MSTSPTPREDAAGRLARYRIERDKGWLTLNDVRRLEDLNPMIEEQRFTALEICRIFEVPPELVLSDIERSRLNI